MGKRVSVHIDERTLSDLMRFTSETAGTRAILRAVEDYIGRQRARRIHIPEGIRDLCP